ncbi:hypothetical protein BJ166DRAFT_598072 [Pestalotiopsis sp. NC0098]|nr:hypothetical protein BJ166DRAFT_598072 [Pestalotiopsis sp. NC0098]
MGAKPQIVEDDMDPITDGHFETAESRQLMRDVLSGSTISRECYTITDFTATLASEVVNKLLRGFPLHTQHALCISHTSVCLSVYGVLAPSGTGKTFVAAVIAGIAVAKRRRVLAVAHPNNAVDNLASKILKSLSSDLAIRKWDISTDVSAMMRTAHSSPGQIDWRITEDHWSPANSTAEWCLKALGFLTASEDELLRLNAVLQGFVRDEANVTRSMSRAFGVEGEVKLPSFSRLRDLFTQLDRSDSEFSGFANLSCINYVLSELRRSELCEYIV